MAKKPPTLAVQYRALQELTPYARNARTHDRQQVAQIVASIREFGFTNPILIDEVGGIIAGHGRVMAAQQLKLAQVPTITLHGLTEAQKRAYVLADNKLALNSGWDTGLLAAELQDLKGAGFDLDLTGFDALELKDLLGADAPVRDGKTDPDTIPEPTQGEPVSRSGDLWHLGRHRVLVGDATAQGDVQRLMGTREADLLWTDPPYNVAYQGKAGTIEGDDQDAAAFAEFLQAAFRAAYGALRDGGVAYVAHADSERLTFTAAFQAAGFKLAQVLVWVKNAATFGRQDYNWQHEPILYGWREGAGHYFAGDFTQTTVIDDDLDISKLRREQLVRLLQDVQQAHARRSTVIREDKPHKSELHPTMKPVALVTRMVESSTTEGQVVLDPFGGSGTTLIVAERTNRRARLLEVDSRYADVIVRRWQDFTGRQATLGADGATFAELASKRVTPTRKKGRGNGKAQGH